LYSASSVQVRPGLGTTCLGATPARADGIIEATATAEADLKSV